MATKSELMAALRAADAAGDTAAATAIAKAISRADAVAKPEIVAPPASAAGAPPVPSAPEESAPLSGEARAFNTDIYGRQNDPASEHSVLRQTLGGLKHGFDRGAMGLKGMLPQRIQDAGDQLDVALTGSKQLTPELVKRGAAYVAETGPASSVGQTGADVGIGAFTGAAGKAGVAGDLATQALLNYVLTPGDTEQRTAGAAGGALGAAGGRVLARTLGGPMKPFMSPESRLLMDQGIPLTPGQMVSGQTAGGGARAFRSMEDKSTSIPILGDIVRNAQRKANDAYNRVEINDALAPLKAKIHITGTDAIDRAYDIVSKTYDAVKPELFIAPNVARPTIDKARQAIDKQPLFDAGHAKKLNSIMAIKIDPLINGTKRVSGEDAKAIDSYLGQEARRAMTKGGYGNEPLGEALYALQDAWRNSMQGTTAGARQTLQDANEAFKRLRVLQFASDRTISGEFSPMDIVKGARQAKGSSTPLSEVARQVLPSTVPDSGTAGRTAVNKLATMATALGGGGAAVATGNVVPAAVGLTGLYGAYSKPGLNYLAKGVTPVTDAIYNHLPANVQKALLRMAPADAEALLRTLTTQGLRSQSNQIQEQE